MQNSLEGPTYLQQILDNQLALVILSQRLVENSKSDYCVSDETIEIIAGINVGTLQKKLEE